MFILRSFMGSMLFQVKFWQTICIYFREQLFIRMDLYSSDFFNAVKFPEVYQS